MKTQIVSSVFIKKYYYTDSIINYSCSANNGRGDIRYPALRNGAENDPVFKLLTVTNT